MCRRVVVHVPQSRHQFGEGGRLWVILPSSVQHQSVVVGDVGKYSLGFVLVSQHSGYDQQLVSGLVVAENVGSFRKEFLNHLLHGFVSPGSVVGYSGLGDGSKDVCLLLVDAQVLLQKLVGETSRVSVCSMFPLSCVI